MSRSGCVGDIQVPVGEQYWSLGVVYMVEGKFVHRVSYQDSVLCALEFVLYSQNKTKSQF